MARVQGVAQIVQMVGWMVLVVGVAAERPWACVNGRRPHQRSDLTYCAWWAMRTCCNGAETKAIWATALKEDACKRTKSCAILSSVLECEVLCTPTEGRSFSLCEGFARSLFDACKDSMICTDEFGDCRSRPQLCARTGEKYPNVSSFVYDLLHAQIDAQSAEPNCMSGFPTNDAPPLDAHDGAPAIVALTVLLGLCLVILGTAVFALYRQRQRAKGGVLNEEEQHLASNGD